MKQPHKHAELIKAWADGAEIEYWGVYDNRWFDATCPDWNPDFTYRIKPEPKPDVIAEGIIHCDSRTTETAAYRTSFRVSEHYERDNIRLTFDGETGKLKKAEVIE